MERIALSLEVGELLMQVRAPDNEKMAIEILLTTRMPAGGNA